MLSDDHLLHPLYFPGSLLMSPHLPGRPAIYVARFYLGITLKADLD